MSQSPWQKCPVCDGSGLVSRPPHVAADQRTFVSSSVGPWQCPTCGGTRILHLVDAPPLPEIREEDVVWLEGVASKPSVVAPHARRILSALEAVSARNKEGR